jgi:Fic family protein
VTPVDVIGAGLLPLLSRADQAVGRLDGVIHGPLLNPNFFVAMYVRHEAVLSSQIEGTQSTLQDLLAVELSPRFRSLPSDVDEVVNYVHAMNYGLNRLADLPLSLRLIREIHAELLRGVRGSSRNPGEFRSVQNWIGPEGAPISMATFVPPAVPDMTSALDRFERFLHDDAGVPALLHVGLSHAQFETIHPFLDGNGRVGRLLITFQLVHRRVLHRPLLYLSHFFKRNRAEYYDRLMGVRDSGDWEGWLRFFLRGVGDTAAEATLTATRIVELREAHRVLLQEASGNASVQKLLDILYERPLINVSLAADLLGVSFVTANKVVGVFEEAQLLQEITGGRRSRIFRYTPYLALFDDPPPDGGQGPEAEQTPVQSTAANQA